MLITPKIRSSPAYAWLVVAMLWLVCFFNYADRQAIFSVFSLLKSEFALSDLQLGVVASCFMWVYAGCGPLAGWITDRVPRALTIVVALGFWSLMTGATVLVHSYSGMVVLRGLAGLGEAFYFPAAMSLIASYHGPSTRSRAMSIHQSSVYVGTIAGGSLSAYLAQRHGWRSSFEMLSACGLLLAVALAMLLRDFAGESVSDTCLVAAIAAPRGLWAELLDLARKKPVLLLIGAFIGANFVAVIFLTWMPTFLQRKFSMDLSHAAFNGTVYLQVASVAGVIAGGYLADAFCRRRRGGRQLVQAIGLLSGAPFLFFMGYSGTVGALFSAMIGFGLFKGLYDANIWASLYDFVEPSRRGFATGLMNSLGWLGGGLAPIAVAALELHATLSACISLTSVVYMALGLAMFALFFKRHEAKPNADSR